MIGTSKSVWGFDPRTIPGCQLWLDGADQSSMTFSGSSVTIWNDKSGNGYNMNTLTPTANWTGSAVYPTVGTPINGNSTVNFTAQAGLKQSTTLDGVKNFFWVGRIAAPIGTGFNYFFLLGHDTYLDWTGLPYGDKFMDVTYAQAGIYNASPTSLFTSDANAIQNTAFVNVYYPTAPNVSLLSVAGITGTTRYQGICYDRNAHIGWCGDLAEVLIYSTALTTSQRQQVEGYLAHKWGLQTSIPSTHPFYSIRPHLRAFQPIDVPGCALWLDAADQSSMTLSGSSVTQWSDKSGTGNNATAIGTTPTIASGGGITFSAGAYNTSYSSSLTNESLFVVFGYTRTSGTLSLVGQTGDGARLLSLGAGASTAQLQSSVYNVALGALSPNTTVPINTIGLGELFTTNSTMAIFYNGTSVGTPTAVTITSGRTSIIGGASTGGSINASQYFGGIIYEVIGFTSALTTSQRQQVEGYLAHKWGLTPTYASNTPLTIPGCQLWLDGADSSSLVLSGSNVTQWNDKSGNGFNGTVVNASVGSPIAPSYVTNSINGLPAITMSGTSYFQGTTNVNGTVCTSFFVGSCTFGTGGSSQQRLLAIGELGLDDYSVAARCILLQVYSSGTKACPFRAGVFPTVTIENSSINLYSVIFDGTNASIYLNGNTPVSLASSGSFITNIYAVGSDAGTQFMGGTSSLGTNCLVGKIGEILVYNTALTTSQRQQVEGYLARKWGISISATLPSPHSFKSFPPASLPFSPRNISGLQLWLDAADSSTITGTTSVTAWRDKSTNGYVANSFVNSVPNPSLVPNIRNGNGVIQYTAGNGSSIANFVLAQTMSIFKVYYPINQSIGSPFIEQGPNVNNESGFFFHSQNDNNFYIRAGSIGLANFGTTTVSNTWQMIEGINPDPANGNTVAFYVNGTTRASGGTQSDTTTITKTLYINGRGGANNLSYNTYLAELIIYNIGLTSSQRQQVEGYLAHKWGMSASLPSTHPYSKFPPP